MPHMSEILMLMTEKFLFYYIAPFNRTGRLEKVNSKMTFYLRHLVVKYYLTAVHFINNT